MDESIANKVCSKCRRQLNVSEFHLDRRKRDGYCNHCKSCKKTARQKFKAENAGLLADRERAHYAANSEQIRARRVAAYWSNPEAARESARGAYLRDIERSRELNRISHQRNLISRRGASRRWRESNPEHVEAYRRKYYKRNREAYHIRSAKYRAEKPQYFRDYKRNWYRENQERARTYLREWHRQDVNRARVYGARRRARLEEGRVTFTVNELEQRMSMFGFRCYMCSGPFETVDHVKPLAKGGPDCLANLRPACKTCNSRKRDNWPYKSVE